MTKDTHFVIINPPIKYGGCTQNSLLRATSNSEIWRQRKFELDRIKLLGDVAALGIWMNAIGKKLVWRARQDRTGAITERAQISHQQLTYGCTTALLSINWKQMLMLQSWFLFLLHQASTFCVMTLLFGKCANMFWLRLCIHLSQGYCASNSLQARPHKPQKHLRHTDKIQALPPKAQTQTTRLHPGARRALNRG